VLLAEVLPGYGGFRYARAGTYRPVLPPLYASEARQVGLSTIRHVRAASGTSACCAYASTGGSGGEYGYGVMSMLSVNIRSASIRA
jgi:hypothetical protein